LNFIIIICAKHIKETFQVPWFQVNFFEAGPHLM